MCVGMPLLWRCGIVRRRECIPASTKSVISSGQSYCHLDRFNVHQYNNSVATTLWRIQSALEDYSEVLLQEAIQTGCYTENGVVHELDSWESWQWCRSWIFTESDRQSGKERSQNTGNRSYPRHWGVWLQSQQYNPIDAVIYIYTYTYVCISFQLTV